MEKKRILEEQEQREFLKDIVIRDKDTLLLRIKQSMEDIVHEDSVMELKPMEYYKRLKLLLNRFYEKVTKLPLMYISDECWGYGFRITEWGVILNLIKVGVDYEIFSENENSIEITNYPFPFFEYKLSEVQAMMLSPEAYAEAYGVKAVTVRQWIRRGKLRAAKKVGNSWKISELCSKPSRGYTSAEYNWKEELENLPVDFEYFNNYNIAQFYAKTSEPGKYEVVFVNSEDSNLPLKLTLSLQERERLELFMISHPQIECEETYIHEFLWKV